MELPPPESQQEGWTQSRGGPQRQGHIPQNLPLTNNSTLVKIGSPTVYPPISIGNTSVFTTGKKSMIVDASPSNPQVIKEINVPAITQPAIAGSTVLITTRDSLRAFDINSGEEIWRQDFQYRSNPIATFTSTAIASTQDRLQRIDTETGDQQWNVGIETGLVGLAADSQSVVLNQDTGSSSKIIQIDIEDGSVEWTNEVEQSDISPVLDERVLTVSKYGRLSILSEGSTELTVESEIQAPISVAVSGSVVIVGPGVDGTYAGVDIKNESVLWKSQFFGGGEPLATEDFTVIGVRSEGVLILDSHTGNEVHRVSLNQLQNGVVPTAGGLICFGGPDDSTSLVQYHE
ncbi:PQQ-binding-like beta-propeller repeat protein [Haloferax denitrificans]|uniref:outer membrane protein assembly factor BamB family protein n=1 Tax=Haloferax denitrificans TaxID=35745 RepID=UPI003C6EDED5